MNAPIRHRLAVASRAVAAIGGGYAVAALSAAAIALWTTLITLIITGVLRFAA